MKQIFTMLAVLVLAAALTACGEENRNNPGTADQDRPGTNQSQNAQRDDGAGGSWQNGTDTPAQPGASVGGAAGSQENTRDNARMGRSALRRDRFFLVPTCIFRKIGYDMREKICAAAGGREKKVLL